MTQRIDLTGKEFGRWRVIRYSGRTGFWGCVCSCGVERDVSGGSLRSGVSTSCGCHRIDWRKQDLTGQRFGRLVVVASAGARESSSGTRSYFACRCDCGQEKTVLGSSLVTGATKSCGCLKPNLRHGESSSGKETTEYRSWAAMLSRCTNPNSDSWADYGGRGISVCERWRDYPAFLADMGRKPSASHSIDRVDVNGNYQPGNCRWSTKGEQVRNRRPFKVGKLARFTVDELRAELKRRGA